eukprot:TRINITY_DN4517_c0_g1_i2.p1 TRINITY_DN4517_c0_g1~~TRINITY_DN4517_c0_g1_i2.p1  ORF type:complete len:575 (+),score=141.49 TRINITY_DN4517_c0_g1_i2:171-1895(+)
MESFNRLGAAFLSSVVQACKESGDAAEGWRGMCKVMETGATPDITTFNMLLATCAKARDLNVARACWKELSQRKIRVNTVTYNTMINVCARGADLHMAEQIMHLMLQDQFGAKASAVTFTSLITSCAQTGQVSKAEYWFSQMANLGITADQVIYNCVIDVCAKASKLNKAEEWMAKMIDAGLCPDIKTYNSLINAAAKSGNMETAEKWFFEAKRAGCTPDIATFGAMIHAGAKSHRSDKAIYWLEQQSKHGLILNIRCLNTMLHAVASEGDAASMQGWYDFIKNFDIKPNAITYGCIVHGCARAGQLVKVLEWLRHMVLENLDPDLITCRTIITALVDSKSIPESSSAAQWAYGAIICAYAHAGKLQQMMDWLQEMKKDGVVPASVLIQDVCNACISGNVPQAVAVAMLQVVANGVRANNAEAINKQQVKERALAQGKEATSGMCSTWKQPEQAVQQQTPYLPFNSQASNLIRQQSLWKNVQALVPAEDQPLDYSQQQLRPAHGERTLSMGYALQPPPQSRHLLQIQLLLDQSVKLQQNLEQILAGRQLSAELAGEMHQLMAIQRSVTGRLEQI